MQTTTLSSKGQVIIPKALRATRQWGPGTRLEVHDTPVAAHINPPLSDREDAVLGGHRVASTAAGSSIRLWIA